MMCAKLKIEYTGSKERIIKALFVDLADMDLNISELSLRDDVKRVVLQDYQSVDFNPQYVSRKVLDMRLADK